MKTNVCLIATFRQPLRTFLLLALIGMITFGFMTKAVQFILIQRETEVLGNYYRSIGVLENIQDPISGNISAGINLIETSPYFAYGDQREVVSGVLTQTYNRKFIVCNCSGLVEVFPEEEWPNVHLSDMWFTGDLILKEELLTHVENGEVAGYYLQFHVDTVLAAYPEYAQKGRNLGLFFVFKNHESAFPLIEEMEVGQRYFIRGWDDSGYHVNASWYAKYLTWNEIKPLDDGQLWYIPLEEDEIIDFNDPTFAPFKNKIDILNENLHTPTMVTTVDMSAIPLMQEASRFYYLTDGRWLNHQDHLEGNKVVVVTKEFAMLRDFELGDDLQFTFRPLKDAYYSYIRDGEDALNWRGYPTYQEIFKIVGIYANTNGVAYTTYIPTNSIPPVFISATQPQNRYFADYSFVLDDTRHEAEFVQAYKEPLEELGIRLTILENNGPAYWAAVDPIRRSLSADILIFGLLMVVVMILAVFLYQRQRRHDYAILRALGVPVRKANTQLVRPLYLLGGLGIIAGGFSAWQYALDQAKATLLTIPTSAGVTPSADLNPLILVGLCAVTILLLVLVSQVVVFFLARKPVLALLQGNSVQPVGKQKLSKTRKINQPLPPISSSLAMAVDKQKSTKPKSTVTGVGKPVQRRYTSASLSRFVLRHILRSRLKSFLTLAIALGFVLAAGWVRQTMERSRLEVDRLFDTTVVEADIFPDSASSGSTGAGAGSGFVYQKTINHILDSGFIENSVLESDTFWFDIEKPGTQEKFSGKFPVYAYDSPETFSSGLGDLGSLNFAPDWDMDRFAKSWTAEEIQNDGVPALFPTSLLDQLEIDVGEIIWISGIGYSYKCAIVGQYSGGLVTTNRWINQVDNYILIPLSVLESIEVGQIKYTVAHFELYPEKNRILSQFRTDMEEVIDVYVGQLRLFIWDEELRIVINQLEKNISLLEVLYPVVIAVSALVSAGLCFLLLLQAAREAAILRVLGTTRRAVWLALISEPLILSIIGVVISLGISRILWMTSGLVPFGSVLTIAGLYLAGALAGSVTGALLITNKMPIELLQVKE